MDIFSYLFMAWVAYCAWGVFKMFRTGRVPIASGLGTLDCRTNPLAYWAFVAFTALITASLFTLAFLGREPRKLADFKYDLMSTELVLSISTPRSVDDVVRCFLEDPTGGLRLRHLPDAPDETSVLANQILHVLVRVKDEGAARTVRVYLRPNSDHLYGYQQRAIERCA